MPRHSLPLKCGLCTLLALAAFTARLTGQEQAPLNSPPAATPAAPTPAAPFGEITGTVKSGNTPLPGVTVTAANTLTGKKYITSTDVDGSFKITVGAKGRYVVRAEFSAFAPGTQEVLLNPENRNGKADISLTLLSRAQQQEEKQQQQAQQLAASGGRGPQQLSLAGGGEGGGGAQAGGADTAALAASGLPNAGLAAEGNTESVAVSGAMGRNDMPTFDPGEMQDRMNDLRDQISRGGAGGAQILNFGSAGGFGGGAGGPMVFVMGGGPGGVAFGGGGRGFRNFNINKPHGSIFYTFGGSPLDARPFSLNGVEQDKADYDTNRFGVTIGGPLNIPHLYNGGMKTFLFGNYSGTRGTTPFDLFSTVPTQAQRSGDFSGSSVTLVDPTTHAPLPNNQITNINPTAAALLKFIPMPNLPGADRNFHFVSANQTTSDILFVRFNHSFGADPGMFGRLGGGGARRQQRQQQRQQQQNGDKDKDKQKTHWTQSINGGFNFNRIDNQVLNAYPGLGGTLNVHNYAGNFGYNLGHGLFLNSLRFSVNRSNSRVLNNFTDTNNIEAALGIHGVSSSPNDFGLPVLNFAQEFSGLQDTAPSFRDNQNFSIADSMSITHGKHSWSWGGDYRRQFINVSNAPNARGTFVFNGAATGLPFADFLLGFPQQTSIQFGASDYHFRANSFDLYVQDNWRAAKNLTLNLGLRYEYVGPFTELNGKLANLDVAPGFTAVTPVLPGQTGTLTGTSFPDSLVKPDRNNFAPRVGIAWKPFSKTVVRSGYGINYNLGQYAQIATLLGFQPPFAFTETNTAPVGSPTTFTLQNGFPPSPVPVTNSYAIDPNYRLAYVQTWNLNIQQETKWDLIINIGYSGSKGTHLDIVRAPSLDSASLLSGAQAFRFESSEGDSILHSGTLRVRKRMRHGFSIGGTYTYSKSIDNASSIGGGAVVVAQNDLNLAAERGLSSFDQRHRFTADYYYELPFGKEKKWLKGDNWAEKAISGFSFSGNVTLASGLPFSPLILGSAADLRRGVTGSLRPNLVPGASIGVSDPSIQQWFNTAAFVAPTGQFGDAGRNIIIGPGTIDFDMALSKTIQVKEMQSLEVRISATNVFNHANFAGIDTILGSPTFGQVTSVGSMRKMQLIARYRF